MKILVVSQCFHPDIYGINDIVKTLVERGHEVTVLTGLPDYKTSKIPKEYKWLRNRKQHFYGAEVFRVSTIARHHGAIFRCLNYMSFAISGWLFAKMHKWKAIDVIYVWGVSPVTMAIPAIALKKRLKKPLFLYCMDLWPESIKAMGFHEGTVFYSLVHSLSNRIYLQCDHIAVSSTPFLDYIEKTNGYPRDRMSYLPQYAAEELVSLDLRKSPDDDTHFLFVGNVGKVQNVECIIKACSMVSHLEKVTVHIVGGGSNLRSCQHLAEKLKVTHMVRFYGPKHFNDAIPFYKIADACLLTLNGDSMIGNTLPGKLQAYMAAGKPIIGAINGAGQQVILESECGLCVSADDIEGLAVCMESFAKNAQMRCDMGKNAHTYFVENFTAQQHFTRLEKKLFKLSTEASR